MNKLISSTEHVTRSEPCRVVFSQNGPHHFGGALSNLTFRGKQPEGPVHHIFTIDTMDKYTPIRFSHVRFVPLVFPLTYGNGGGRISYRVTDELEIEIGTISEWARGDETYFPGHLPGGRAKLTPLTYPERRILGSDIRERSFLDRMRMKRLWNGACFKVAGMLEHYSDLGPCQNPETQTEGNCSAWKFAEFPATRVPFGAVWHDYASDVYFIFAICMRCGSIHGFIDCT